MSTNAHTNDEEPAGTRDSGPSNSRFRGEDSRNVGPSDPAGARVRAMDELRSLRGKVEFWEGYDPKAGDDAPSDWC